MTELVTLAEAKTHLRITTADGSAGDADIQMKLDAATAIIVEYCATTAYWKTTTAEWDADTVPLPVKHAILLELGELYRFRGDDPEGPARDPAIGADLAPAIVGLLRRSRDPVVQ